MIAVSGDPLRTNAYAFAHNGILGYPTTKPIRLPADWARRLREARAALRLRGHDCALGAAAHGPARLGRVDRRHPARSASSRRACSRARRAVGQFPRQRVELIRGADPVSEVNRLFRERGWTDGLPIVPPTLARVDEMLGASPLERHARARRDGAARGVASVEKVAANAVMAGATRRTSRSCWPRSRRSSIPRSTSAACRPPTRTSRRCSSSAGRWRGGSAINAGWGALGPGWPANATIGRAVRLVMNNLGGGWPGAVSFAGLGQPARYSLCLAEREDDAVAVAARGAGLPARAEHGHGAAGRDA